MGSLSVYDRPLGTTSVTVNGLINLEVNVSSREDPLGSFKFLVVNITSSPML
jgi:hypothetical protein